MRGDLAPSRETMRGPVQKRYGCSPPNPTRPSGTTRATTSASWIIAWVLDATSYEGFDVLAGSYASFFFQSARVMAAILRASVTLARFGLVPAASCRS